MPGNFRQSTTPSYGFSVYMFTSRYVDAHGSLQLMDPSGRASFTIYVGPFKQNGRELGFTRGFTNPKIYPFISAQMR